MKGIALKSYLYSLKDKDPNQPLVYEGIESAHHLYREMNKTPVGTEVTVIYGKENTAHRVSEK